MFWSGQEIAFWDLLLYPSLMMDSSIVNFSGRSDYHERLLQLGNVDALSPIYGNGGGWTESTLSQIASHSYGKDAHNDFIKIYLDYGAIGLLFQYTPLLLPLVCAPWALIGENSSELKVYGPLFLSFLLQMFIIGWFYENINVALCWSGTVFFLSGLFLSFKRTTHSQPMSIGDTQSK
jgi:hypothetical protein